MLSKLFRRPRSSASRQAGTYRHPRRPSIEALEDRRLLTVTTAIVLGRLQIVGDDSANRITLDHSGGTTSVSYQDGAATTTVNYADSDFNSISIYLGTAENEYLLVAGTPAGRAVSIYNA